MYVCMRIRGFQKKFDIFYRIYIFSKDGVSNDQK